MGASTDTSLPFRGGQPSRLLGLHFRDTKRRASPNISLNTLSLQTLVAVHIFSRSTVGPCPTPPPHTFPLTLTQKVPLVPTSTTCTPHFLERKVGIELEIVRVLGRIKVIRCEY